jgi:hypothetical protein
MYARYAYVTFEDLALLNNYKFSTDRSWDESGDEDDHSENIDGTDTRLLKANEKIGESDVIEEKEK